MKKFFAAFWKMFRSNLVLKIMAVLFAVILWSFVLSQTNPLREREIPDVPVIPLNADTLKDNGLAISGNLSDILGTVDVRIRVNQNDLKLLSSSSASASVDLSTINKAGEYRLPVIVETRYQKLDISPSEIRVVVDQRKTKDVPVSVEVTGSVAEGYYAYDPKISPDVIRITGAKSDVDRVRSARCTIDLSGLEEGYGRTEEVTLLDAQGAAVDSGLFSESITSVIVDLSVLPVKTVRVDAQGSMTGSVAPGYEISDIKCSPETVRIVGERSLLDGITSLKLNTYSVAGLSLDTVMPVEYALPEGVRALGADKAEVTISIREITKQEDYKSVGLELRNLSSGLGASADPKTVDVTIIAGETKLSKLLRRDVVPYVDLDGLEPGQYTLNVMFEIPEGFVAENFIPDITTVKVTISRR